MTICLHLNEKALRLVLFERGVHLLMGWPLARQAHSRLTIKRCRYTYPMLFRLFVPSLGHTLSTLIRVRTRIDAVSIVPAITSESQLAR
jgi:hypothetical protein